MTPDDQKIELEKRISDAAGLQYMIETPGYAFLRTWLDDNLTTFDAALKGNGFVGDHPGYLNARALYAASKNVIDFIEGTIADGDTAKRELSDLDQPDRPPV